MNPVQYAAIGVKLTRKQKKLVNKQNKENKPPLRNGSKAEIIQQIRKLTSSLSTSQEQSDRVRIVNNISTLISYFKPSKPKTKNRNMPPKFIKRAEQAIASKAKQIAVKEGKKFLRNNAEKIGVTAGGLVGSVAGPAAGLAVGAMAEHGAIKIAGNGDYTVTSNSLFNKGASVDVIPKFSNSKRGTRVVHCEYLGDVISSSTANTFAISSFVVNPGNPTTFPWLAPLAANYDQWRPNGIVFAFKSTSSSYSGTTQALGGVVLASDYDLVDPTFASKIEMENSAFANSCKSDVHILHPIECNPRERQVALLKCRGVQTPSDNLQWYDLANFQVATFGVAGTSVNLGELWVTYDITFFKEQVYGGLRGSTINSARYSGTASITTSAYLGTDQAADADNTFSPVFASTTLTFPALLPVGTYLVTYRCFGTSTAYTVPTITATSGCSLVSGYSNTNSATATNLITTVYVTLTGPSAVLTFSGGTLPTTPLSATLLVQQVNPSFTA